MPSSADGGRAWVALAATLALASALATAVAADTLEWQPARAWTQPWRAWSAAVVHYSSFHLAVNLVGTALVAALGWYARVPRSTTIAWLVAWPLTQFGLLARPDLLHYAGLSGVLHAGTACVGWQLAAHASGQRRAIGVLVLAGLAVKLASESPWGAAVRTPAGWDIATAPFAHASGLVAGLAAAIICDVIARARGRSAKRTVDPARENRGPN